MVLKYCGGKVESPGRAVAQCEIGSKTWALRVQWVECCPECVLYMWVVCGSCMGGF